MFLKQCKFLKIILEEYNPDWKTLFEAEKLKLEKALAGTKISVEHIGSTSVDGLGAKPIIDILLGIPEFSLADTLIEPIKSSGYNYIAEYNKIIPDRRFFKKEKIHLHLVEKNTTIWKRHIAFRDHLRENKNTKEEYYLLKKKLSEKDWKDGNEYAAAKTEFIRGVEEKLNFSTSP